MIGLGMIFDDTYRPFFERVHAEGLYDRRFGIVDVPLVAVASRTGARAERYRESAGCRIGPFVSCIGVQPVHELLKAGVDFVCVATPDDRHFAAARAALAAGVHVLIEKPSVLTLSQLDELTQLAQAKGVLAKVVYHKLLDPDHKKLRTLVADGILQHVNNGYCSLLEPRSISGSQFAEWITGRNPGTYVAVHYIKLIDFTFGGRLKTITATGQRGIVGPADGPTWDSCQMRMVYEYDSPPFEKPGTGITPPARQAAFDIHTSWVNPDNFPGYVEQEVQFRFDNGVWNGHSRKRGVECTVEGLTPTKLKTTLNNHYSAAFLEPWGERSQRGYGIETLERFVREVGFVERGGPATERTGRLQAMQQLTYNELAADRQTVAAVQSLEAILDRQYRARPDCVVRVNDERGGLVLYDPHGDKPEVLYESPV
ncbi:MAG: Gfo/Idh/MocA family oxidoreductase [Planctomycetaceae bacterium]|nr:Gfo/Idh/MocA family oxidoreductase [Planctomycetaceae bacterium]